MSKKESFYHLGFDNNDNLFYYINILVYLFIIILLMCFLLLC